MPELSHQNGSWRTVVIRLLLSLHRVLHAGAFKEVLEMWTS